ncbi:Nuclease-related domain protein [compost metagenome]
MPQAKNLEIYVGGPITNGSERQVLLALTARLQSLGLEAVIFANVFLPGRQIDIVLATAHGAWVVEVKASRLAIRGGLNGTWLRRQADGSWRRYRNAYQQALDAKFALRDALAAWDSRIASYPAGEVVFTPAIPVGSELTAGDAKVCIRDLDGFLRTLPVVGVADVSLTTWRAFAAHLKLERLDPARPLLEDDISAETARNYRLAFYAQYGSTAESWMAENQAQVAALLNAAQGAGVHISGPSGCGKSLMAHRLAVDLSNKGHPVLFVAGKNLTESWRDTVRREVGLLVEERPDNVLAALRRAPLPLVLVFDGINEIRGDRSDAIRGALAMTRRYDAILIITDQAPAGEVFAGLNAVRVTNPSLELKRRIASASALASNATNAALNAVSTGLEAALIGRIGASQKGPTTRLQLLERYARERLGEHARLGTLGLRRLASRLLADIAYSLPEPAFDDFMISQGVTAQVADALVKSGLLVRRAARISFGHEMFLTTFAAFDLASDATRQPTEVGELISRPQLERIAADVVSAIDDADVCRVVLASTTNVPVLTSAIEGELGPLATDAAATLLRQTAHDCTLELKSARLELCEDGEHTRVDWADCGLRRWSPEEQARLRAIGDTAAGASFDLYMELCAEMDAIRHREWTRLIDDARRLKFALRSQSFGLAYYNFGKSIGFSLVRHTSLRPSRNVRRVAVAELTGFTSGQLHFVLESRYALFNEEDAEAFAAFLIEVFAQRYRFEPYHVRLSLLSAAGFVRNVSEDTRKLLVAAIEGLNSQNWALDSSVIDALKFLGALDDEGESQRENIRAEIRHALGEPETEALCTMALSLCVRMFDHPFDTIYFEEIDNLNDVEEHTLLRRAASAPEAHQSMSLSWVIARVADLADPTDGLRLRRFAHLPGNRNVFPQEEWASFILVTRYLGRHGLDLPESRPLTPSEACLTALREIVYSCEAKDVERERRAWRVLAQADCNIAMGCLSEVQKALSDRHTLEDSKTFPTVSLTHLHPTECLALSRAFLDGDRAPVYHHQVASSASAVGYALRCVAGLGDRTDVPRIRKLTREGPFVQAALETLKVLELGGSEIS